MINNQTALWRKGLVLSATFLFSVFLIVSCKKKENLLGQNTIDQNELLGSSGIDTFSLQTFSYFDDSVISDNAPFTLLGSYNDPVFGTYNAEFYTQVLLSGSSPDFGNLDSVIIDSMVLGIEYIGSYGTPGFQNVEVYEIGEELFIDSTYYSFQSKIDANLSNLVLGSNNFEFNTQNITVVGNDTIDSQLRIPLDTILARTLMTEANAATGTFVDDAAFTTYFKGLHVKTNNGVQALGTGGVAYFNLTDPLSKLTIYYRQFGESKTFDFLISSNAADFNHVDIDNSLTNVETVMNDTVSGQVEFYTQSFGSRAVVKFAGINNIPATAVIHKATLELPVSYQTAGKLSPGLNISVATTLEEGATDLFGVNAIGNYSDFSKSFTVDLRAYVQAIVSGNLTNTGLVFSPVLHSTSAERIIFNGPNSTNKKKPKLSILYTEF
ncbi:MAG TPA: DUF4270 family protein [Crocinitomicaceae bacterium]|nr:DUF4270 family protein [Crocinitomicaceae bacterium]